MYQILAVKAREAIFYWNARKKIHQTWHSSLVFLLSRTVRKDSVAPQFFRNITIETARKRCQMILLLAEWLNEECCFLFNRLSVTIIFSGASAKISCIRGWWHERNFNFLWSGRLGSGGLLNGACPHFTTWYMYPTFNGSHFGLPPSEIHRMTGLPARRHPKSCELWRLRTGPISSC